MIITSRPSTSQSLHLSIKFGDQYINPSEEPPKNLGVIFDSTCSLRDHVFNVCRSINFNLYWIGKIREYLDRPTVEKLVNATITSRLDYCNILTFGSPKELISQLQKRQYHATRIITKWRKFDHITAVLVDLHWLPVKQRIDFKTLLLTYKALNGLAPAYMRELLIPYSIKRTLRSNSGLNVSTTKSNKSITRPVSVYSLGISSTRIAVWWIISAIWPHVLLSVRGETYQSLFPFILKRAVPKRLNAVPKLKDNQNTALFSIYQASHQGCNFKAPKDTFTQSIFLKLCNLLKIRHP